MNLDVQQAGGGILLISQFTLYGDCRRGRAPILPPLPKPNRPARGMNTLIAALRSMNVPVETGVFAERMEIDCLQDGPVTIPLQKVIISRSRRKRKVIRQNRSDSDLSNLMAVAAAKELKTQCDAVFVGNMVGIDKR